MLSVQPLGQLVPGPASEGIDCLRSNNNLDLARCAGRDFLVWRTAPTHFASSRARLEVSSRKSGSGQWRHELTIALGRDLREPRLVTDGGRLHLFFLELGTNPTRFQPRRVRRAVLGAATWSESEVVLDDPVVPWRIRSIAGRWVMLGYRGAESMYGPTPSDPVVEARLSDDLENWGEPIAIHRGGTECEVVELPDGFLVGLTRNEGPRRFGSDLLAGPDLGSLSARPVGAKLDSPHLFLWQGEPWLVARRSLAFGGRYDVAPPLLPGMLRIRANQLAWWVTRKRSALFRLGGRGSSVEWVADLGGRGDTSFAGIVAEEDGSLLVADYSSAPSVGDPPWVRGQLGPTVVSEMRISRGS